MRKKVLALGLTVLAVLVLWTAGWFWASGEIRRQVGLLAQADGPKLACGTLNVSGFPFRFDVECRDAMLVDDDLTVGAAGLRASVLTYNPTHVVFSALAPVTLTDAFTGSESRVDFTGLEGSARVTTSDFLKGLQGEGWRLARASLVVDDLALVNSVAGDLLMGSAKHIELHALDIPEQLDRNKGLAAMRLYAQADAINVPSVALNEAGASLDAELTGLPADLRDFAAPNLPAQLQANSAGLQLQPGLKAETPDASVAVSGNLTIDGGNRPAGQLQITSKGVVERFNSALEAVPEGMRGWVIGKQAEDGSYSQTLTMRAGVVLSGLVPLGTLDPLF